MHKVVPLASTLRVPAVDGGRRLLEEYLERILEWSQLGRITGVDLMVCSETAQLLIDRRLYPFRPHLEALFQAHGIDEYAIVDILNITDAFLANDFECAVGVDEVLFDAFSVQPCIAEAAPAAEFLEDTSRVLVLVSLAAKYLSPHVAVYVKETRESTASVRATVHDLDASSAAIESGVGALPADIECSCALVCCDRTTRAWLDAPALWRGVSGERDAEAVIDLAVRQALDATGEEASTRGFSVHKRFLESAHRYGFVHNPTKAKRLLGAIVDIVIGRNLRCTHALREGVGGEEPRVMRDDDVAWRMDVDDEFHLHYWQLASGGFEFSCVVVHNDFAIFR